MSNFTAYNEASQFIIENWGEKGKKVLYECAKSTPFSGTLDDFLNECTACGGNWCGMFLSGIKKIWPNVYDAIPDNMGANAFFCICYILSLLSVKTE